MNKAVEHKPLGQGRYAFLRSVLRTCSFFGINPQTLYHNMRGLPSYCRDMYRYELRNSRSTLRIDAKGLYPVLSDRYGDAGAAGGHYFYQDLWAAKKVFQHQPGVHVDIGSRIDGFVAHVLTFMPVTLIDIRPMKSSVDGLSFIQDDATNLKTIADGSLQSVSTLHAAEHFGLGRYSDPVDPEACFRFMQALKRVLAPCGRLYFSVPVGKECVKFNAHRIFSPETILQAFSELELVSFSLVDDHGRFVENIDPRTLPPCNYSCGMFEFTKPGYAKRPG